MVTLLGVGFRGSERFMMTEYLSGGSLRNFIHTQSHLLNDRIRWKIAKCIADGNKSSRIQISNTKIIEKLRISLTNQNIKTKELK